MKTRMYFGRIKTALLGIVAAGALAVIILDICLLAGVGMMTSEPVVAGVSMAAGVIVFIAALLILFNSYYNFKEEHLLIVLGFFADKLPYENIVAIKQNNENKDVYIVYKSDEDVEDEQSFRMNTTARQSDKILEEMRKHCPFIIVETFTPPEKKKKK